MLHDGFCFLLSARYLAVDGRGISSDPEELLFALLLSHFDRFDERLEADLCLGLTLRWPEAASTKVFLFCSRQLLFRLHVYLAISNVAKSYGYLPISILPSK